MARSLPVVRARVRRAGSRRCGRAFPASGLRATADRGPGDRASAAPGLLPACAPARGPSLPRGPRGRSGRGSKQRSSRSRSATVSRVVTRPSSPGSCSGSSSRPGRSTRSIHVPARRSPAPTRELEQRDQARLGRQHRRDRLEDRRRQPHPLGRPEQPRRQSSGSLPDVTASRRGRCSASASPGSSAPTAGVATTTSTPTSGSSAGPTCSETSPPTAKAWPSKKPSGRQDS